MRAINLGSTSLGIQTADGVIIAAEKRIHWKLAEV